MLKDKVQILLSKISSLTSDEHLSLLEKDLVKGYIRELYEIIDQIPNQASENRPFSKGMKVEETKPEIMDPVVEAPLEQPKQIREVPIEEDTFKSGNGFEVDIPPIQPAKPLREPQEKLAEPASYQKIITQSEPIPSSMESLFATDSSKELSEKLANQPISDLSRAFSINERLLFTNELFSGNNETFLDIIDVINRKYSFEEAKSYLIRYVIDQYKWMDEKKIDRAREFVSFVRRRYLD